MPRFSILMPAFQAEATVSDAVGSVLSSTVEDWELVLVDDGSTDGTVDRVREITAGDPRVRILQRPHRGLVAALTAGLAECRAPIVARLDADDRMSPDRLALQRSALESGTAAVVGGGVDLIGGGAGGGMRRYVDWLNSLDDGDAMVRDLFVESPVAHSAASFRVEAVRAVGGYRDGPFPEDYDLWLRLWEAGYGFATVPETVLHWRHRKGRATFSDERYSPGAFRRLKIATLLRTRLAGHRTIGMVSAGRDAKLWSRELADQGVRTEFWVDVHERRIGRRIHGAPVISYPDLYDRLGTTPHLLVAVGIGRARLEIRQALTDNGFVELRDFTCVA